MPKVKREQAQILDNQIWQSAVSHRRVCGVLADRVYYSRGGDSTLSCKLPTFQRWIKDHEARLVRGPCSLSQW